MSGEYGKQTIASTHSLPLCVDLDGSLLRSDSLFECALAAISGNFLIVFEILRLLLRGRAVLKRQLAEFAKLDPSRLPYNESVLQYLKDEKSRGRTIILATAADQQVAQAIAGHLRIFDGVLASNGERNLKGATKAKELVTKFGEGGFHYLGNDRSDIEVWRHAAGAVVVNGRPSVVSAVERCCPLEHKIENRRPKFSAIWTAFRPHQWTKNLLIFVPIITGLGYVDWAAWQAALILFLAFSAVASGLYIFNDLHDLDADRRHMRKRNRPFARGDVPLQSGLIYFAVLFAVGLGLAVVVDALFYILAYALTSLAYSISLKKKPLIDVFVLGGLYMVRLYSGGDVAGYPVSMWLLAFSGFLFLALALMKRVAEMQTSDGEGLPGRGYKAQDRNLMQQMGLPASFVSCVVLALYVRSEEVSTRYLHPETLWLIVPLILYWQCRMWLSTADGRMNDDPIVFAARDRTFWLCVVATALVIALARPVIDGGT